MCPAFQPLLCEVRVAGLGMPERLTHRASERACRRRLSRGQPVTEWEIRARPTDRAGFSCSTLHSRAFLREEALDGVSRRKEMGTRAKFSKFFRRTPRLAGFSGT